MGRKCKGKEPKIQVVATLDADLVRSIDKTRTQFEMNRSEFIEYRLLGEAPEQYSCTHLESKFASEEVPIKAYGIMFKNDLFHGIELCRECFGVLIKLVNPKITEKKLDEIFDHFSHENRIIKMDK